MKCEYCGNECEKLGSIGTRRPKLNVCHDCWCLYTYGGAVMA